MNEKRWSELVIALRNETQLEQMVAAAGALQAEATPEDVPRLVELLNDESFFVREAAAWPLSDLAQIDALPQLLKAYQRGLDEGHDNDGFSAALIDLVEMNEAAAKPLLLELTQSADNGVRETASWLLGFAEESHDA
jgi:HEAT repeat protein